MKKDQHTESAVKPANEQIQELAQWLIEVKSVFQTLSTGMVDVGQAKDTALFWDAEEKLDRIHDELEKRVNEQTAELDRSNRFLQALIETMPVGVIIAYDEGKRITTNAAGREILGSEVSGTLDSPERDYGLYYPNGSPMPQTKVPLMHALKYGHTINNSEIVIRHDDGTTRVINAGSAPVHDENGKIMGSVAVFQDITELKKNQTTLNQYTGRLKILHEIDQAILAAQSVEEIVESTLHYLPQLIDCIRSSIKLYDWESGKMSVLDVYSEKETQVGIGWHNALPGPDVIEKLLQGKINAIDDIRLVSQSPLRQTLIKEGIRAYINIPLFVQGELVGSLNLGKDTPGRLNPDEEEIAKELANLLAIAIQQNRLKEQLQQYAAELEGKVARRTAALQTSEARFRTIFEDSVLGIAVLNSMGQILASNPAMEKLLGFSDKEILGKTISDLSHPDDAKEVKDLFRALASKELGYYQIEERYIHKDGQVRWYQLTVSRVKKTRGGSTRQAIAMVEDITEKKLNQEALLKAERLAIAGRLGASLAHEINNPLQSVIGFLGLAEEMMDDGTQVRRYLEIAMEELERAAGIVTQLRDLSRESKFEKKVANLNTLVEKALLLTKKRCQNRHIHVEWNPSNDLPEILLAPDRILQVFLNLVLNSIEAMPEGGNLDVGTISTEHPKGVQIEFTDTGVGIAPERLTKLYEPFHSSRPDGLGLGLYISKNIIDEHAGKIEVASHSNKGTTFTIWLPAN